MAGRKTSMSQATSRLRTSKGFVPSWNRTSSSARRAPAIETIQVAEPSINATKG